MVDNNENKDGFNFQNIYSMTNQDGYKFVINVFNGNPGFTIWPKERGMGTPFSMFFSREITFLFIDELKKIIAAEPGKVNSFVKYDYNKESNKYDKVGFIIKFIKDEKGIYALEISSSKLNPPVKFTFSAPGGLSLGSDNLTQSDKSKLGIRTFLDILINEIPKIRLLSRYNYVTPKFNNRNESKSNNSQSVNDMDSGMFG